MQRMRHAVVVLAALMVVLLMSSVMIADATLAKIRYAGQYYPEEFVLAGMPELWTKYGIEVEHTLFSSGAENNVALISGAADINCGSDSKTVSLFTAIPEQALIIGVAQRGDRYSTIVHVDSPYQSWYDLKGKKVGTRLGTGAEQVLRRYFELNPDLDWDDFEWVNIKIEDMTAALANRSIEAFTAWEPTPAVAETQGIGRSIRSFGDVALTPVFIHTTVSYAEQHRAEIVRFLAAHLDKAALIKNDPEKAAAIAAEVAGAQGAYVAPEAFAKIFERVDFSLDLDEAVVAALQDTANFLYEQEQVDTIPQFRWDASFLEEAKTLRDSVSSDEG
ncbi:MAG: ABC transporter substrate-binding protein [Candidatus Bipolaricaulia bacterium]